MENEEIFFAVDLRIKISGELHVEEIGVICFIAIELASKERESAGKWNESW